MARQKKTSKMETRDSVTLNSVFTDIANAIRAKTDSSDTITPRNMGNAIRGIKGVTEASLPEANLPSVFQDIANAIRACGITGTMTASQMAGKIGDIVVDQPSHSETIVRYTTESGLPDWSGDIVGDISGTSSSPYYTTQIPNVQYAKEIEVGNTVTGIVDYAFYSCSELTSVTIPDSMTIIGDDAFSGCGGLTNVIIPDGVASIGNNAFYNCSSLTSITIPNSVTSIGYSAFSDCSGLTIVTIGSGVTRILNLFGGCSSCMIFDFRSATQVPTLTTGIAFQNTPSNKEIIVPDSLYDDWITATNWSSTSYNIVNCIVKASQSSLGSL